MDFQLLEDTICAISTPVGEGGVGIIKISGPDAPAIARKLFKPHSPVASFESHRLYYGRVLDPASQEIVDEVLLSYMAAPHTYTREHVVEINCHSGYMVLNRILELALTLGARLANPGEFTRRAFLNGRLDLSQAEAVLDIIHSRSQQSLHLANRHLRGEFREQVGAWRERLVHLQSHIEAHIDFSEDLEEDVEEASEWCGQLEREFITPIRHILSSYEAGRILREGLALVLVGKPNVGKSSLLNALVGRDRAIVTPHPGTTRDVIEESFLLSGIRVRVLDTAGIRREPDAIESIGIERTIRSIEEAHGVLWIIDQSRPLTVEDDAVFQAIDSCPHLILLNKADLPSVVPIAEIRERFSKAAPVVSLSVFNAADVERLRHSLRETFLSDPLRMGHSGIVPNLRHKECFELAMGALERAKELLHKGGYAEVVSMELQSARKHLDAILGREVDCDLLDRIFSQFCVGK